MDSLMRLYDAHNHLQDERLKPHLPAILGAIQREGIVRMVVNGSCEADWAAVLELARAFPSVVPSFGLHPWYVGQRSAEWQQNLVRHLDSHPSAVGEIGLDRWIKNHDLSAQTEVFIVQLRLAAERDLPASIHCLQAWGKLLDILRAEPRPRCGFVLHSFGGPQERILDLVELGAYFSFPGYFALERKARQRDAFRHVPAERLLIETDAPDQVLPAEIDLYQLTDETNGKPINHPANLAAVYRFVARMLERPLETLVAQIEENFCRLFGPGVRVSPRGNHP
jgi:TatD DNase family protein